MPLNLKLKKLKSGFYCTQQIYTFKTSYTLHFSRYVYFLALENQHQVLLSPIVLFFYF
jgi:hypothetical protein